MNLTRIIGVSIAMLFAAGSVYAADQSDFAVLNGAQAEKMTVASMDEIHGKHMSVFDAATGELITDTSGTNSVVLNGHIKIFVGGGAATLNGLPCAVCN